MLNNFMRSSFFIDLFIYFYSFIKVISFYKANLLVVYLILIPILLLKVINLNLFVQFFTFEVEIMF